MPKAADIVLHVDHLFCSKELGNGGKLEQDQLGQVMGYLHLKLQP